jgi:hypothetical protein
LPSTIKSIGVYAFSDWHALSEVYMEGDAPELLGDRDSEYLFKNNYPDAVTKERSAYPNANVYVTKNAQGFGDTFGGLPVVRATESEPSLFFEEWQGGAKLVTFTSSVDLDVFEIPSHWKGLPVTTIGFRAFWHSYTTCPKKVILPTTLKTIERYAFWNCDDLEEITIPDSVVLLAREVFWNCRNLKKVQIGAGITEIKEETFKNCGSLEGIILSNSIVTIGSAAFTRCNSLSSVTIPNSVKSMGEGVFYLCSNLAKIEFIGDAPAATSNDVRDPRLGGAQDTVVHVKASSTGFGDMFWGLPVVKEGNSENRSTKLLKISAISGGIHLKVQTEAGGVYQMQQSADLLNWGNDGPQFLGTGEETIFERLNTGNLKFWKVILLP